VLKDMLQTGQLMAVYLLHFISLENENL